MSGMERQTKRETPQVAEVVQVIHTLATRGAGTHEDPVRHVHQYWSFDGTLLSERDPCQLLMNSDASSATISEEI